MMYSLATLAFALGASAISVPRQTCTFSLTASGGRSGSVGQLSDGQNRVGGNYTAASYSIANGQITDSRGRGCILTPPSTQFQCDVGATPTSGFAIGSNGVVTYNGANTFYACPANSNEYNIYTVPVANQALCVKITLTASGCFAAAPSSSNKPATSTVQPASSKGSTTVVTVPATSQPTTAAPAPVTQSSQTTAKPVTTAPGPVVQSSCPAPVTVTVTVTAGQPAPTVATSGPAAPATSAPATPVSSKPASSPASSAPATSSTPTPPFTNSTSKVCPTNLSGAYQYPHLIVPVSSAQPNRAFGTSYNGVVNSTTSSIFNFDIPTSYTGTCSLIFLFPTQAQLQTSSFTFSGPGSVGFTQLSNVASQSTTFANQGAVKTSFGTKTVTPGSSTVISTFACPAGQAVSYELSSVGGTALNYFQDYNPSPIGLYITSC